MQNKRTNHSAHSSCSGSSAEFSSEVGKKQYWVPDSMCKISAPLSSEQILEYSFIIVGESLA